MDRDLIAEMFSLRAKPKRTVRPLWAVFPDGSRWQLSADASGEWSCPVFENGEQTGMDCLASTLRDLKADLAGYGVTFERE